MDVDAGGKFGVCGMSKLVGAVTRNDEAFFQFTKASEAEAQAYGTDVMWCLSCSL